MATAIKHKERSHRSYRKNVDFSTFERNAKFNKAQKEQAEFFAKLFHKKIK